MLKEYIGQKRGAQREFANRIDVSEGYLSLLLSGAKIPSMRLAMRIERETGGAVPVSSWHPPEPESVSPDSNAA